MDLHGKAVASRVSIAESKEVSMMENKSWVSDGLDCDALDSPLVEEAQGQVRVQGLENPEPNASPRDSRFRKHLVKANYLGKENIGGKFTWHILRMEKHVRNKKKSNPQDEESRIPKLSTGQPLKPNTDPEPKPGPIGQPWGGKIQN